MQALLLLSGGASLIYQVIWARHMTLVLGGTARGVAMVLATFMLGLALGAIAIGRYGDKVRGPLRLYGVLEIGAAVTGLAVTALAAHLPSLHASSHYSLVALAALALLVVPTVLMGATLPAMLAYVDRVGEKPAKALGPLYSANTFGALAGAALAGFVLIENLGLWGAACVAAALEVVAGVCAIALDRTPPATEPQPRAWPALPAACALFVSGLVTLGYEILFTRLLLQGFLGTAYSFTIILAAFLGGLAIGAAVAPPSRRKSTALLGAIIAAGAALALAFAPLVAATPELVELLRGNDVRFWVRLTIYIGLSIVLIGLPAVVWGMAFPMAAGRFVTKGRAGASLGGAYLVNTLGAVAGSLATGFWLLPALGVRGALIALALVQAGCGLWLMVRDRRGARVPRAAWALAGVFAAAVVLAWPAAVGKQLGEGTSVPPHTVGKEHFYRVLYYREGASTTTTVVRNIVTNRRSLFLDGFVTAADGPGTHYMPMMGHLPALLHPDPKRGLVIGFGTGSTARALGSWPLHLDVAEINPDVLACAEHFTLDNLRILPHVTLEDGRTFLHRSRDVYDIITLEPMPPHFAGAVNLYSREFYELARGRLADDGILVQWLPLHLVSPDDSRQILATLQSVFPETHLFIMPGDMTGLAIGSPSPIEPERAVRRLREGPESLRAIPLNENLMRTSFVLDPAKVRAYTDSAPLVTDDRPRLEYSGIYRVLDRFKNSNALLHFNLVEIRAAFKGEPK